MMLRIGELTVDVDAIVFDKDGTLLDNNALWATVTRDWVDDVVCEARNPHLLDGLLEFVGVTLDGSFVPNGLSAVEPTDTMAELVGEWLRARGHMAPAAVVSMSDRELDVSEIQFELLGDVDAALARLHGVGLRLGIATSDRRASTEATLEALGWAPLMTAVVCADDSVAAKPDGAVLLHLGIAMGVSPDRIAMVGDSHCDMLMAQNGGAAIAIGVTGGGGDPTGADVLISTIEELVVV